MAAHVDRTYDLFRIRRYTDWLDQEMWGASRRCSHLAAIAASRSVCRSENTLPAVIGAGPASSRFAESDQRRLPEQLNRCHTSIAAMNPCGSTFRGQTGVKRWSAPSIHALEAPELLGFRRGAEGI
jgi:hypothetical protein